MGRSWNRPFGLLLLTLSLPGLADAALGCDGDQLPPFEASYAVQRNGKLVGQARASLKKHGENWIYRMDTEANRGLAGLLGGEISELSRFRMVDGAPQAREYRYEQGIRFSKRSARASFDWDRLLVAGEYRKDKFQLPLVAGQTDRMLVNLKLMMALKEGLDVLDFDSVDRGRVDRLSFERIDQPVMVDTPQGRLVTVQVSRLHRNPRRQTHSWHAPDFAYLPVRMQQIDSEDDETIEMTLKSWEWQHCQS